MVFKHNDLHHQEVISMSVTSSTGSEKPLLSFSLMFHMQLHCERQHHRSARTDFTALLSGISLTYNALGRQADRFYPHQGTTNETIYL